MQSILQAPINADNVVMIARVLDFQILLWHVLRVERASFPEMPAGRLKSGRVNMIQFPQMRAA